jgi:hypothetical protein
MSPSPSLLLERASDQSLRTHTAAERLDADEKGTTTIGTPGGPLRPSGTTRALAMTSLIRLCIKPWCCIRTAPGLRRACCVRATRQGHRRW